MEQNSIMKDLFKKLETVKREHSIVESQRHEDQMKIYSQEGKVLELIRQSARAIMVDPFYHDSSGIAPSKGWVDNYNNEVSNLRALIEKNEGIRKAIGKIPIEDVALVEISDEHVRDIDDQGRKTAWYYEPFRLVHPYANSWVWNISYLHGGPGSPARVFFRKGNNGHRHLLGVFLSESSKTRKGHPKEKKAD